MPYESDSVGNDFGYFPGRKTGELGVRWEAERLGFKLIEFAGSYRSVSRYTGEIPRDRQV